MFDIGDAPRELSSWQLLCREISALGFDPPPDDTTGVVLTVPMASLADDSEQAARFLERLAEARSSATPVCLRAADPGEGNDPIELWQTCCERIREVAGSRGLSVCMPAHLMPVESFLLITESILGKGPRFLFLDSLQFERHGDSAIQHCADSTWASLWQQRGTSAPVMPVYGGIVRSGCPLLSAEVATHVLPQHGLQVPAGSAWLPIGLRLTRFMDEGGNVDQQLLECNLERLVPLADQLFDSMTWPCRHQREDAALNRRLAITISGFGDVVARSGHDPTDLVCLRRLTTLICGLRRQLQHASAALATRYEPVPALTPADLTVEWRAGTSREAWQSVWRDALSKSAVRHRNLVVISPYSVLPDEAGIHRGYADLLPIIGHADAWSFANPHPLKGWNIKEFRHFHARARAIIRGSNTNSFVAAGV